MWRSVHTTSHYDVTFRSFLSWLSPRTEPSDLSWWPVLKLPPTPGLWTRIRGETMVRAVGRGQGAHGGKVERSCLPCILLLLSFRLSIIMVSLLRRIDSLGGFSEGRGDSASLCYEDTFGLLSNYNHKLLCARL